MIKNVHNYFLIWSSRPLHIHITQKLYDGEKAEFAERLQELEDKDIPMETVLTFVIMANNFDESSEYVRKVVGKSLDGIDLYPKARQLLTFLVISNYINQDVRELL